PALLCSLVHMTGDPSWIRGELRPAKCTSIEFQGGMSDQMQAEARRQALAAIAADRDAGCAPHPLPRQRLHALGVVVACAPAPGVRAEMMLHDLSFDGGDCDEVTWGGEIPEALKADSHVVVIGCGESGLLAGIRLQQAGLPFTIVEKASGP